MARSRNTADTQTASGGPVSPNIAGKNKIINGDFGVWQRGTSFTASGYTADRWYLSRNNTTTVSQQTFTPGTAPVSGYEGTYFLRCARTAGSSDDYLIQRVEDMRAFAGQIVTISFWAKADTATTISQVYFACNAGSGGSGAPGGVGNFSGVAVTTSWARYTVTATMASIAGATIGTSSYVEVVFKLAAAMGNRTVDIWGVQWEAGSVATPFVPAGGTIQGELAACQRYYYLAASGNTLPIASAFSNSASLMRSVVPFPVPMRVNPSLVASSGTSYYMYRSAAADDLFNSLTIGDAGTTCTSVFNNTEIASTSGQGGYILTNNASASVAFSAEL